MFKIILSNSTKDLISSIYKSIKEKYIVTSYEELESDWARQYDVIKGSNWPKCKNYEDFKNLPEDIKTECIQQHNFSPDIYYDSVINEANSKFKIPNEISLRNDVDSFLISHSYVLQNKKIIDLACNFGYFSVFCHNQGSSNVVGIDVRSENIQVAKSIQKDLNLFDKKIEFKTGDLHDYSKIKNLCADKDTVLLLGIMYHVHDHFEILKTVCQPNVSYVVIESGENSDIIDSDQPLIWWRNEFTFDLLAGFSNNKGNTLVGYPNAAWFDLAMKILNFKRVGYNRESTYISCNKLEKYKQFRSMYLYVRC